MSFLQTKGLRILHSLKQLDITFKCSIHIIFQIISLSVVVVFLLAHTATNILAVWEPLDDDFSAKTY
jgi:hypothetical protein